jgi:TrmH family RNA methyltransferase
MKIKGLPGSSFGNRKEVLYIRTGGKNMTDQISQSILKSYQKLLLRKYREQEGKFIIEGAHLIDEAISSGREIENILITNDFAEREDAPQILHRARKKNISVVVVPAQTMDKLTDAVTSQGAVAVLRHEELPLAKFWKKGRSSSLVILLDAIADPGNLGTIIRTADWFGADAVFIAAGTVDLYNPKVLRATMGSLFHLPVYAGEKVDDLVSAARAHGYSVIVTTSRDGVSPSKQLFAGKSMLVFGNEANGLSDSVIRSADVRLTIPRSGRAESLNVAMSVAVLLGYARL